MKRINKYESTTERECLKCRVVKPYDDFHANIQQGLKKHIYCKQCRSIIQKESRKKDMEERIKYNESAKR